MSYLIVSRDFWPNAAAIGDGLLCLARQLAKTDKVSVVTMSRQNLAELDNAESGHTSSISFLTAKPLTTSSSSIIFRIIELIYFSIWLFVSLLRSSPSVVYVATNPPLLVPFVVAVYCKIFRKKYVYHVQDIHPEAASLLVNIPKFIVSGLKAIDAWVLNSACKVVTLTEDMKTTLLGRGVSKADIILMENPSAVSSVSCQTKTQGIVFSGNAGRLQLMGIVLDAIEQYLQADGQLKFCFVGSGVYKERLLELSKRYKNFSYEGYVDGDTALKITSGYRWGLLPILPAVLAYAYPSKIPAYISAGCEIISVTDHQTSLAKWVESSGFGENIEPSVEALKMCFCNLEALPPIKPDTTSTLSFATIDDFAENLYRILKDCIN
ncbi:MAG: glycosyltransferase [Sedimenticola sp.]|nr:glycosyltransferase [Sedimenticola sp.]